MKRLLFLLPLLTQALLAEASRVEIIGPPGAHRPIPTYTASPGGSFRIELGVEAPLGAKVALRASTRFVTQGLAAPVQTDLSLAEDIAFTDTTRRIVSVDIPTPEIKGPATLRVDLRSTPPGESDATFHLRLVPRAEKETLSRTLAAALEKSPLRLAIYGESPQLRRFLQEYGIEVKDLGTLPPSPLPEGYLVMSEAAVPPRHEAIRGHLLLFHPAPERLLPGVYQRASAEGRHTVITFPLFAADSPDASALLINLLCEELL